MKHQIVTQIFNNITIQFYLAILGDKVDSRYSTAAVEYIRPVSKGSQSYETIPSEYPLTQAMPKLTATLQVSIKIETHTFYSIIIL